MKIKSREFVGFDQSRMGFNSKENDNEVKGDGASYDYGFRIYDPRLGKFLSVDPLFKGYPWYTPYQFAGNTPIQAIDLDGLEEFKVTKTRESGKLHIRIEYVPPFFRTDSRPGANDKDRKVDYYYYGNSTPVPMNKFASPSSYEAERENAKGIVYKNPLSLEGEQMTLKEAHEKAGKYGTGYEVAPGHPKRPIGKEHEAWYGWERDFAIPEPETIMYENQSKESLVQDEALIEYAKILLANPELSATVTGYTSAKGGTKYNEDLSKDRAQDIKDAIVKIAEGSGATGEQLTQLKTQIKTVGAGETGADQTDVNNPADRKATVKID